MGLHLFILVTQLPGKWCSGLLSCPRQVVLLFSNTWSGQWGQRDSSLPRGIGPLQRYHRASPLPWGIFLEVPEQQKLKSRFILLRMLKKGSRNLKRREEETSGGPARSPQPTTQPHFWGGLAWFPVPRPSHKHAAQGHRVSIQLQFSAPQRLWNAPGHGQQTRVT